MVFSTIIIESAPLGIGAPVIILIAKPDVNFLDVVSPAGSVSIIFNSIGFVSVASVVSE
ncbi:MAG: Uncharacterised protein [Methanobacteriota archaeon]|nr:MAG: Uncharacterised protein [Euryarchaeota archaeon]